MTARDERRGQVAIVLILVVAAALRFTALDYGRGIDARPDEPGVMATLDLLGPGGATSPLLGLYGATFFLPLYAVVRLAGLGGGWTVPIAHDRVFSALVTARAWSATLSVLAVWLTYRLGLRIGGVAVGLVAAALLAVSPLVVREAHSAKADTAAMAMTALWLVTAVRPWSSATRRAVVLGGLAAMVVDVKLLVGIGPALLFAVLQPTDGGRIAWRDAVRSLATFGIVTLCLRWYVFAAPAVWVAFSPALLDSTRANRFPGAEQVAGPLVYHTTVSFRFGCGLVATALVPFALARGLRGSAPLRLCAVAVVGIMVPVLLSALVLARFVVPALPAVCVLVAVVAMEIANRVAPRPLAAALALCLLSAEPLHESIALVRLLGRTDTRLEAAAWIATHIPPGSRAATWGAVGFADFGSPPMDGISVRRGLPTREPDGIDWLVVHAYPIPWSSAPPPDVPDVFERAAVFSPYDGPTHAPVLEPLDAFYLPLARFDGIAQPGPYIEVYRRAPPPARPQARE